MLWLLSKVLFRLIDCFGRHADCLLRLVLSLFMVIFYFYFTFFIFLFVYSKDINYLFHFFSRARGVSFSLLFLAAHYVELFLNIIEAPSSSWSDYGRGPLYSMTTIVVVRRTRTKNRLIYVCNRLWLSSRLQHFENLIVSNQLALPNK